MNSLYQICVWLHDSSVGTGLRESLFMFPLVEGIHVLALSLSVGLILFTDLRLIGVLMKDSKVSDITKQLKPWMLAGFIIMFITGGLLFWSEAVRVYASVTFRFKLLFLFLAGVNALVFETTIGRQAESWDHDVPPRAKLAGWISLICWAAVVLFGRWTAYGLSS
jgi:hypothetical protein